MPRRLKKIAESAGYVDAPREGLKKVEEGITSLEEALSATIGVE
jgi:type II secretory ATPase GspE/PulE/Tfp pilus assembly ATPase PilB-like protein